MKSERGVGVWVKSQRRGVGAVRERGVWVKSQRRGVVEVRERDVCEVKGA